MRWLNFLVVLCLVSSSHRVQSASILALFSSLSFSDHLVFRGYISSLVQKGHSVVMMTPYPGRFDYPDVERIVELDVGTESGPFWKDFLKIHTNVADHYTNLKTANELSIKLAIAQLKSKQVQALLINPNIKFDLVITEAEVPILYAAADKYKAPHISITASSGRIHQYEAKGNPIHPILYPDVNTLNMRNLTRWQKLVEFNRHIQTKYEYYNNYLPLCDLAAKKILGLQRDLQEVEYDIDLLFIAANPLLIGNRPTVPAIIYTDRLHIRPGLSLPQNLKTILDSATKGVVYFSIGAIQEPEQLSQEMLQTLADSFKDLPFTILWKIANTTMFNVPGNVITQGWFPQQEVLAHPNVKVFLTHGGPLSLEEAVYYETPIVGLPLVKSRKVFIREITKFGAGEIIDPYFLEKETLKVAITKVATDEKYKAAIIKVKSMVVDPFISGPENAVWWTEYVLRHGGARILRSPAVGVTFIQYYMLDIISYLLAVCFALLWISFIILRAAVRRVLVRFSKKSSAQVSGKFKAL